jgi:hypothetical protein
MDVVSTDGGAYAVGSRASWEIHICRTVVSSVAFRSRHIISGGGEKTRGGTFDNIEIPFLST